MKFFARSSKLGSEGRSVLIRGLAGFSLIELLVVMALIAVLSLPIRHLVREGSDAHTMKSAQDLLVAQLAAARNQAMVSGNSCRLLVYSHHDDNPDVQDRLQRLLIVVADGDGAWRAVGPPESLPGNIRMVPKSDPPTLAAGAWGSGPTSTVSADVSHDVWFGDKAQSAHYYFVEFSPLGNTRGATLVLSPAVLRPAGDSLGVCFTSPAEVCGVRLSQYGASTLIPHALAFQ